MSNPETNIQCRIAVLDYARYANSFEPLIQKARKSLSRSGSTMEELKLLIANVKERQVREEALTQFDRLETAIQSNKWHYAAAGTMLELACTEEAKVITDLMPTMPTWIDILYTDWDENQARAVESFFSYLPDHTLDWASPSESWRAAVSPDELADVASATGALTPRQFSKYLSSAENGDIFDSEEAEKIANWWNEVRSVIRTARRQDAGILISVTDSSRR